MSRKFISALSGTYNVHANEVARGMRQSSTEDSPKNANNIGGRLSNLSALITGRSISQVPETIKCVVHFLDDTEHIFEVDRAAKGEELMDSVFRHLELIEREFFALQFTEIFHSTSSSGHNNHHNHQKRQTLSSASQNVTNDGNDRTADRLHPHHGSGTVNNSTIVYNKWLDPTKKVRKQMRFCTQPFLLHFRVKFYVTEMSRLLEEYTRYHFYLQLRKDILTGRLCQSGDGQDSLMTILASYVLQSELGDYCEEEHKPGYSNQFSLIPNQTDEFCHKVESLHRLHQGQTPADAELNYLEEAKHLDLYGVDLHSAKDREQQDIKIGVSSNGLTVYKSHPQQQQYTKINMFSWAKIVKISFKRRYFFIQLKHEGTERYDNMIGFNLCSYRACKSLWKSCVEQHTFFRLHTTKPLTKKFFFFFSLGSKFRYSGKTEFQTIEENRKRLTRTERIFIRNTGRNATMPVSLLNPNQNNQKAAITDAQKHIVNLKLLTIANDGNNRTKNGTINYHLHNKYHNNQQQHRPSRFHHPSSHSPALSSMESTCSGSLSSSASSLLGPTTTNTKKQSTMIVAVDTTYRLSSTSNNNNSVLLLSSTSHQQLSGQQQQLQQTNKTINNSTTTSHVPVSTKTLSTSTSTSPTSSLESSFIPLNLDDKNEHLPLLSQDNDLKNTKKCDSTNIKDINNKMKIVNSKSSSDLNVNPNTYDLKTNDHHSATIITIGANSGSSTMGQNKVCSSLPTAISTFTAAYTPSTLISLPYIDSLSTASDKTSTSLTNGGNNNNNNDNNNGGTHTPTITEDLTIKDSDNDHDDEKKLQQKFNFDSPIRELIKELYDGAAAIKSGNDDNNSPSDLDSPVHVVTVSMKPDQDGRFGFNVKGGYDQNCPVLVSRVAPNTPADNATPKLHEGDQVLAINGMEVSGLKHEEVVQLIRSTKDLGPEAKLVLSIRPNVYYKRCHGQDEDAIDNVKCDSSESTFHYTLNNHCNLQTSKVFSSVQNDNIHSSSIDNPKESEEDLDKQKSRVENVDLPSKSLLDTSMNLLHEGLQGDLVIYQFEFLPRRDEDESITIARYLENVPKNRYLDIAPYDSTRVVLNECNTGDYINASFVTMKVEASGVVNRYIATQGPLKRTTSDFWQMVWEQRSTLIVMVTPLIEDGRKKCFKYWPDKGQTMVVNDLLDLIQEDCQDRGAFLERRFKITDPENKKTHYVTHLQYLAWPDQGVPDDDTDFLKLIFKVRELRGDDPDSPVIVHCSAGIGRTGVLILMETGICLIEANQPVYPLELVRMMRSQRAMLIQTSTQFRFVCEALYRVYRDQLVKPLDQFLSLELS